MWEAYLCMHVIGVVDVLSVPLLLLQRSRHYTDVIMTATASQITSLTFVYSTVYSDADQRKHQSSASLAFVSGIHGDWWIPHTKGQLRRKCFHLMKSSWKGRSQYTLHLCVSPSVWGFWLLYGKVATQFMSYLVFTLHEAIKNGLIVCHVSIISTPTCPKSGKSLNYQFLTIIKKNHNYICQTCVYIDLVSFQKFFYKLWQL